MQGGERASGETFDPQALESLQRELAERMRARGREAASASWEVEAAGETRPRGRPWLLRGAVIAALLGVLIGALAAPDLGGPKPEPMKPRLAMARTPAPIVGPAASPDLATQPLAAGEERARPETAPAPQPAVMPPPRTAAPPPPAVAQPRPLPAPGIAEPPSAVPETRAEPTPALQRASFDCGSPRSLAEEMVCADPELARRDLALGRALREARAAGVADSVLRRQHVRWAMVRERAAYEAPWRLADIYEGRIDELREEARAAEAGEEP